MSDTTPSAESKLGESDPRPTLNIPYLSIFAWGYVTAFVLFPFGFFFLAILIIILCNQPLPRTIAKYGWATPQEPFVAAWRYLREWYRQMYVQKEPIYLWSGPRLLSLDDCDIYCNPSCRALSAVGPIRIPIRCLSYHQRIDESLSTLVQSSRGYALTGWKHLLPLGLLGGYATIVHIYNMADGAKIGESGAHVVLVPHGYDMSKHPVYSSFLPQ